ncbi:MAG TPA: amino acid permease, partial [Solirubrobacteraceae bacterium]|nr:amino acid permease [Solirubrobacteraceae bacterium]
MSDGGESSGGESSPHSAGEGDSKPAGDAPAQTHGLKPQAELGRAEAERIALQISARSLASARRSVGSPTLFAIVYTPLASAIYFSLGVISGHALGLTPIVFLVSALLFALTAMTYAEGASLHQERSGSTVFARYAFNELVSFIAGWAILLDYVILIAVTCYSATQYLRVFWSPLGHSAESLGLSFVFILLVVLGNIRGFGWRRSRRIAMIVVADLALQGLVVVLG